MNTAAETRNPDNPIIEGPDKSSKAAAYKEEIQSLNKRHYLSIDHNYIDYELPCKLLDLKQRVEKDFPLNACHLLNIEFQLYYEGEGKHGLNFGHTPMAIPISDAFEVLDNFPEELKEFISIEFVYSNFLWKHDFETIRTIPFCGRFTEFNNKKGETIQ